MIKYFEKNGVDATTAESAFKHAVSIDIALTNSKREMALYQVNAVPALVVNSHYKTDLQMAGSQDRLFAILDYLVSKTKQEEVKDAA